MSLFLTEEEEMRKLCCLVCITRANPNKAQIKFHYRGEVYYECCSPCQAEFERTPEKHLRNAKSKKQRQIMVG